jgi:membrane protease YdiL (CAAX protease family)
MSAYLCQFILLGITWWLYHREGKSFAAIGLNFKARNLLFLPIGMLLGIIFLSLILGFQMLHDVFSISINKNADYSIVLAGIVLLMHGVINEELIFRGYCFQQTVTQIGIVKTNLLFALFFLVWHWISFNAWGNYPLMLGLITTSFGHLLFATALRSSGTLYFSMGLHLGINWASQNIFYIGKEITSEQKGTIFIIHPSGKIYSTMHDITNYGISIVGFLVFTWVIYKWRKIAKPA